MCIRDRFNRVRFYATASITAFTVLISGCGLIPVENVQPTVEFVNDYDFDVAQIQGGPGGWEEAIMDRAESGGAVRLILAGSSTNTPIGLTSDGVTPANCENRATSLYFLRIVDDANVEFSQTNGLRTFSASDFELVFTLGPGYCFDSGDRYVIGDPFDAW